MKIIIDKSLHIQNKYISLRYKYNDMTAEDIKKEREKIQSVDGEWLKGKMAEYGFTAMKLSECTMLQNSTFTRLKQGLSVGCPTKSVLLNFFEKLEYKNQLKELNNDKV